MKVTKIVVVCATALLVAFNIYAIVDAQAPISLIVKGWAFDHLFVPFSLSALIGHWFSPLSSTRPRNLVLGIMAAGRLGADLLDVTPRIPPWSVMIAGLVGGATLWGQGPDVPPPG